ncbi:hypothetical protein EON65_31345 [archaeon]|nr:MAG: hypothetical protein EON65_31345 [archaeon]
MISSSPGEILDLLDEVNVVRYEAEGCRLQGGPDQLSKALLKFNDALSILNEIRGNLEVSSKWTVTYSRCLMGLAIAYADQGHIDEAESSVHGSLQLLATLVSDTEIATGQSNSDCIWLHEQLLDMICSAIKDVYFKASGDSAQSDNPYLHKAGVLLHWYAGLLVGAVSPQTLSIADACSQPVDIGRIAGVNNLLMSLMSKKLPFLSAKRAVLHKLLSLGSSLNMRYQEHEAAFRIYQHGLAQAEPDALVGQQLSDTEIHALGDMRRECIRCAIQCCDSSPSVLDSEAKMRLLDNIEIMLNTLVDYFEGRSDAELWGDLFRLKGEVENETLSFCLYGACYNTHGRGDNSEMKRLADKMNSLEAQVRFRYVNCTYEYLT